LLQVLGGDRNFAYRLPGAGDLYVTAQGGRTVRLGRLLGSGKSYREARQIMAGETLESAEIVHQMSKSLPALTEKGLLVAHELPLLHSLIDILVYGKPVDLCLDAFFTSTPISPAMSA
jgi:glycerol-3-phosphate dehydrogenase (NAD(P)+)